MASSVIDSLLVKLDLDSKNFQAGIQTVEDSLNKVNNIVKAVGASLVAVFVKNQLGKFADMAQHMDLLSKKTGVSTKEIQEWGAAVQLEGGSAEAFEGTLQHLSDEMQNITINGTSGMVPMLTRLGMSYRNVGGSLKTPIQLLRELSTRFEGLSSQQAFSLGKKLGLDEGTIMLLQKGEKGINAIIQKTSKLAVLNEKDIKRGIKLRKSWQELSLVFRKLGIMIATAFLPLANKLTGWALKLSEWCDKNGNNIKNIFEALAIVWGVNLAQKAIPALLNALKLLFANPAISAAILGFIALWDDFRTFQEGGDSMFNWQPFLDGLKEFMASPLWGKLKDLFKSIWDLVKSLFEMWMSLAKALKDTGFIDLLVDALKGLATVLGWIVDSLKWIIDNANKLGAFKTAIKSNPLIGGLFKGKKQDDLMSMFDVDEKTKNEALARLQAESAVKAPISAANNNNVNNSQTSTTIGNININANGEVNADSIKKIANTTNSSRPTQLAIQSNYGI